MFYDEHSVLFHFAYGKNSWLRIEFHLILESLHSAVNALFEMQHILCLCECVNVSQA